MSTRAGDASWVLLHGTPLRPAIWRDVRRLLTDQPVRVPDCSQVPSEAAATTIASRVADDLGTTQVDVVGHSFGGQIAIELALLRPDRVRSLTLICTRDTPFAPFAAAASALRSGEPPSVDDTLARWFTADELLGGGRAVREARRELVAASPDDWANALDAIARYDRRDRMSELAMPVSVIAAGRDAVSTPTAMTDLANRLPRADLVVHPEWMHMSLFVRPDTTASMLESAGRSGTGPADHGRA